MSSSADYKPIYHKIIPRNNKKKKTNHVTKKIPKQILLLQMICINLILSISKSDGFTISSGIKNTNRIMTTRMKKVGNPLQTKNIVGKREIVKMKMTNNKNDDKESTSFDDGNDDNANKQTIAIVGCGAVGCYYGARLWECKDYNVKFFMRGEHYDTCKKEGLNVKSLHGDITIPPSSLNVYSSTQQIGQVDWVILALKSTALDAAPSLLLPLLKPSTRIIAIMNGLFEDDLVEMLEREYQKASSSTNEDGNTDKNGEEQAVKTHPVGVPTSPSILSCCKTVYGGMALICSNRIAPGQIDHSYAGKLTVGVAAASSNGSTTPFSSGEDEHQKAVQDLWSPVSSKVEFVYTPSIIRGRWTKNVWNLPFNGVSVAMGGITIDKVVQDEGLRRLADLVMDETISVANADLESRGDDIFGLLGEDEKKEMWDLSDNMGPYKTSTMLDMTNRKPMEVKYLFRKAIDRANRLNVPVPHLETLVMQIEAFQRFYNLY